MPAETLAPADDAALARLGDDGITVVIGTAVNSAGLTHAKTVPLHRANVFADAGLGASPVWHVFAIDQSGIVTGPDGGVVGDQRLRIDVDALRVLGGGLAWAPASFFNQDGTPDPACARGTLKRVTDRLSATGIEALVGHELEFVLVGPDGNGLPSTMWAQYGLAGLLEFEGFVRDVHTSASVSGVEIEQFHPEYGLNQFEISLSPQPPVAAADQLVLIRMVVSRVARRHGYRVSLSPTPFAGSVGSGAHQHFSLSRKGEPLFAGGTGVAGMRPDGESAIAGVLAGLPDAQGVLCGSILSGLRIQPGHWAGAHICWGTENREASVRFVRGGSGSEHGANVEVKVVDPSANPYLATATILGLAHHGIDAKTPLPPEATVNPASMSDQERIDAGIGLLSPQLGPTLKTLEESLLVRNILGDRVVDAVIAVRRYEQETYGDLDPSLLAEKFRMAWSV
jgi:glutamine synthetase